MTVAEAAKALGLSLSRTYLLIARRELPHYRYGSRISIDPADLAAFREAHRVEAKGASKPPVTRTPSRPRSVSRFYGD